MADKVAVLIPCYNEAVTIGKVVDDFKRVLPDADIYVYDNNSKDGTADIAREHGAIVKFEGRQGKGNVVRSMFRDIDADYYLMVDGDDTYPAEAAPALLEPLRADPAPRHDGGRPPVQRLLRRGERPRVPRLRQRPGALADQEDLRLRLRRRHDGLPRVQPRVREDHAGALRGLPDRDGDLHPRRRPSAGASRTCPIDYRDRPEGSYSKLSTFATARRC